MIRRIGAVSLLLGWVAVSAFASEAENIAIDGKFADWDKIPVAISDPEDMSANNAHGDYKEIRVASTETTFYALQTVYGTAAPADAFRYYYHILIDADNNPATGVKNDQYEGNPTGVKDVVGSDFYIQIGRRNGADDGISVYHLESEQLLFENFSYMAAGDSMELAVDWSVFVPPQGFNLPANALRKGSTIRVAAFQEGNADGWGPIDWTEPAEHVIGQAFPVEAGGKLAVRWGDLKR